jgi:hypothetical protein
MLPIIILAFVALVPQLMTEQIWSGWLRRALIGHATPANLKFQAKLPI